MSNSNSIISKQLAYQAQVEQQQKLLFDSTIKRSWEPRMGLAANGSISFFKTTNHDALAERRLLIRTSPSDYIFCSREPKSAIDELAQLLHVEQHIKREELTYQKLCKLSECVEPDLIFINPRTKKIIGEAVCFPSKWNPEEKIDKTIEEAHAIIPAMNKNNLNHSIDIFLKKLAPYDVELDKGIYLRANIGFTQLDELNQHPNKRLPPISIEDNNFYIRLEEQAIMKLPNTEIIIFGIRVKNIKFKDVEKDQIPGLINMLSTMSQDMADYKGIGSKEVRTKLINSLSNYL